MLRKGRQTTALIYNFYAYLLLIDIRKKISSKSEL